MRAVAETDTGCALPPAVTLRFVTLTDSEKSGLAGAAVTMSEKEAEWLRVPDVPVNCTVEVLAAADDAAVKLTCNGVPGVRVSVAGDVVTPVGSPLTVTLMVPVNPSMAVAVRVSDSALPPAVRLSAELLRRKEKSGEPPPLLVL